VRYFHQLWSPSRKHLRFKPWNLFLLSVGCSWPSLFRVSCVPLSLGLLLESQRERWSKIPYTPHNVFSDRSTQRHGVRHQSILGPLLFIIHINDPPQRINALSEVILFADDTNVIFPVRNFKDFCLVLFSVVTHMIKGFAAIKLVLNLNKN